MFNNIDISINNRGKLKIELNDDIDSMLSKLNKNISLRISMIERGTYNLDDILKRNKDIDLIVDQLTEDIYIVRARQFGLKFIHGDLSDIELYMDDFTAEDKEKSTIVIDNNESNLCDTIKSWHILVNSLEDRFVLDNIIIRDIINSNGTLVIKPIRSKLSQKLANNIKSEK